MRGGAVVQVLGGRRKQEEKDKVSEDRGESKPSASSSGPAVAQGAVPRSRGGVPMAMDSGNSAQETVKRKAEDVEQEVGEDLKDTKSTTWNEEERGAMRSVDDWEEFAKILKTNAEERVEESKNPGEGMDGHQSVPCCERDWSSISG